MTQPVTGPAADCEIGTLVESVHAGLLRLEELTGGEVDSVATRDGHAFLLLHAQEQFRDSGIARQAAILNSLPAQIALLDIQGVIVSVNQVWRRASVFNRLVNSTHGVGINYLWLCDEARGQNSDEAAAVAAGIREVLAGDRDVFSIEYPCHSSTARRWFRLSVTPLGASPPEGAVVMHIDITEHKQSERRLHAQLQRMHLLEQITRAIGERHDLKSILQVVVRTVEEELPLDFGCICLYDPTDRALIVFAVGVTGKAHAEDLYMSESARIPVDEDVLSRCVSGQLVYEDDTASSPFPFTQRLAASGLHALVAAPLQIENKVFGVMIAARQQRSSFDSTDCEFLQQLSKHVALAAHQAKLHDALQSAYEDLRNTQQAVMQHERLRVLGQMASGIAHDINNAISPITLYADSLLDSESGLSDRTRSGLQTIQQAASDVAATVARMREFYRPAEGEERQSLDLNQIVLPLRDLTRARWEAIPQQSGIVIDLQLDLAPGLPAIQGVASEIREALINLIFNGVDAMPAGGSLTVRTLRGSPGQVDVEVMDTGTGMDEETSNRCLEPFFTTKGERGTGLGLAMVYGVMQRNGGSIHITSARGAGTTVRLSFAMSGSAVTASVAAPVEVPRGLTILLVDDDPILLNSLRETFELDGHTIYAASGGQLGIDIFQASLQAGCSPISIVITDLGMPHIDGRSVAKAVKQASPTTPVILLTGWGERLLAEGHLPPHVDRMLSKPPRLRELREALAAVATQKSAS